MNYLDFGTMSSASNFKYTWTNSSHERLYYMILKLIRSDSMLSQLKELVQKMRYVVFI